MKVHKDRTGIYDPIASGENVHTSHTVRDAESFAVRPQST
jgi:hypothetical protein